MTDTNSKIEQTKATSQRDQDRAALVDDMQGVMTAAADVFDHLSCGDMDPNLASAVAYLSSIALKASSEGPLEKVRSSLVRENKTGGRNAA